MPSTSLEAEARYFADDVTSRVLMCLEGTPDSDTLELTFSPTADRVDFNYRQALHPEGGTTRVGWLALLYQLGLDRSGEYLTVKKSSFKLYDRRGKRPMIRMEYDRTPRNVPSSHIHIHIHAESGYLTRLLASTGHQSPHAVESLHLPTGGDRFRPCVEDFIEFLISECNVAGREGWRDEVAEGRTEWRRRQAAAVVRDWPEVAVEVLKGMNLSVHGELPVDRLRPYDRY